MSEHETPPLLDFTPYYAISGSAAVATSWWFANMFYTPWTDLTYLNAKWTTSYWVYPIWDFPKYMFDNFFFASYFALWVSLFVVGFIQTVSAGYYYGLLDPGFFTFWTQTVGRNGAITLYAVAPTFLFLYISKDADWTKIQGLVLFRLIGDIVVYIYAAIVHILFTDRLVDWA